MTDHLDLIRSAYTGMVWPAVPPDTGALALALQFQLKRSQWEAPETLRRLQFRQLGALLKHAHDTVPFYRERLAGAGFRPAGVVTEESFGALPVLTRAEAHAGGETLYSRDVPATHMPVTSGQTSGSTGIPLTSLSTPVTQALWQAFNLRNQLWHRRDLSLKFVAIRPSSAVSRDGELELPGWGPSTGEAYRDGPSALLHSTNTLDRQLEWLARQDPAYLLTFGRNLLELAREMDRRGMRLPQLREASTYGDALSPEQRAECRDLLGVKVVDMYTAQEAGYIALQCPDYDCYHVQSEGVMVEILDESGRPCAAGETGKVVLTTLHNFAMPFIRYEIGDHAEAGPPCPCGRGLPVIRCILGRERNLAVTPDGRKFHPSFSPRTWMGIAPVRQIQVVQKSRQLIEARVVALRALEPAEERALVEALRKSLGQPYQIEVACVQEIPRSSSGKYEDFIRDPDVS